LPFTQDAGVLLLTAAQAHGLNAPASTIRRFEGCRSPTILAVYPHGNDSASSALRLKISNPGRAIPVRVRRGIVAILAAQTSIRAVVQVAEPPRAAHPGGVRAVEAGSSRAIIPEIFSKGSCPSGRLTPPIHPAFDPLQQAGASQSSPSSTGHCGHSRSPNQQARRRPGCRTATGSAPRRSPRRRSWT
jgi:hypothetical protein